jgi:hypothetical protein
MCAMADPRTDQIAREAARLLETGRADDVAKAIRAAAGNLGFSSAPLPGAGRVRKHAQAMAMQAMGEAAYNSKRLKVWRVAEQIMTVFEHGMSDASTVLVGRSAEGQIDAGVTIHIRLYTRNSVSEIAAALVQFGYDEMHFDTAETRHGRLNQVKLKEEDFDVVLTRCPPELDVPPNNDLFTGKAIVTMTLPHLRRQLDQSS